MSSVPLDHYLTLQPTTIWLWEGILPISGSALLYAHPKIGKSKLALSLCEAVINPTIVQYLGQRINAHGPVLYLQLDTPRGVWIVDYLRHLHAPECGHLLYLVDRQMDSVPFPFDIRVPAHQDWLRRECDQVHPLLVVVDVIRRFHRGKENDSDVMSAVLDAFLAATCPAALFILSHKTKWQADHGADTARGSSALMGAVDSLLNLTKTALHIEARSDIVEKRTVYQDKAGLWYVNTHKDEVKAFIAGLSGSPGDLNEAIMTKLGVSLATAKRYREMVRQEG